MNNKKVLIIGSGPSALHFCKQLLKNFPEHVSIDMIESRPVVGGLLRFGVAPDHFQIKNVLWSLVDNITPHLNNLNIWSNLQLDKDHIQDIYRFYDRVYFNNGCDSLTPINIPGEENMTSDIIQAFDFVRFYNGDYLLHDYPERQLMQNQTPVHMIEQMKNMKRGKTIVIIGNGNVSIDIARVISRNWSRYQKLNPEEFTKYTDPRFLEWLSQNDFERIIILGRRGAVQSGFSIKEFRELVEESQWNVNINTEEFDMGINPESIIEMNVKKNIANRPVPFMFS
jgi:NADPH-dependent glutamate synthase beta subunit-like oxidoreductase